MKSWRHPATLRPRLEGAVDRTVTEALQAFGIEPYAAEGDPLQFCKARDPDGIEIDVAAHDDVFPLR